jgi:multiple sugar transport system permease protein
MLMGYFKAIPKDMEEAAMIDGCTRLQTFYKILLPLSAPGLVAAGIFAFTLAWNEFLYALIFITSSQLQTVPVGLASHIVADIYMWGPLMAGSTMAAIPVIVLYMLAQRALVQGLFAGSVRG